MHDMKIFGKKSSVSMLRKFLVLIILTCMLLQSVAYGNVSAEGTVSDNADLIHLTLKGKTIPGFDPAVTGYTVSSGSNVSETDFNYTPADDNASIAVIRKVQPWTPSQLSVDLWLDAADLGTVAIDSSGINRWSDKSGRGKDAVQTADSRKPGYSATGLNNVGTVTFNGANTLQLPEDTFSEHGTSFVVWKPAVLPPASVNALLTAANNVCWISRSGFRAGIFGNNDDYSYGADFDLNHSYITAVDSATNGFACYTNGVRLQKGAHATSTMANTPYIGSRGGADLFFNGKIGEVLYLAGSVSNADRQRVEGYLAHKWGLAQNLPEDHPYRNTPVPGNEAYDIVVTAEDGVTTKTYSVNVTPIAMNNADLSDLKVNGERVPNFNADSANYTITVGNQVTMAAISCIPANINAMANITGPDILQEGDNIYTVEVTAEDGVSKKIYSITITRAIIMPPRTLSIPPEISLMNVNDSIPGIQLFISPDGNDENEGTVENPFKTLQKARDAVRDIKSTTGLPVNGVTIYLRGGDYTVQDSFILENQDSGTPVAPITYSAYNGEKVKLIAGYSINPDLLSPVTDTNVYNRFHADVRNKIFQVNLKQLGISNFGELQPRGFGFPAVTPPSELFFNGKNLTLSRWPNDGYETIGDIVNAGPAPGNGQPGPGGFEFKYLSGRPSTWSNTEDIWMYGAWDREWALSSIKIAEINTADKTITTVHPSQYGAVSGLHYYYFNVLEELDTPGEWYLDRQDGVLYLYPPEETAGSTIQYSMMEAPVIQLTNVSNVKIAGIGIEAIRTTAIVIEGGENNLIAGCEIKNAAQNGVVISGKNNGIYGSELSNIVEAAIKISGGNRSTLEKGQNFAQNNHIYNFGKSGSIGNSAGINMSGTGNYISHNTIHNGGGAGIEFSGNENIIEYNEISNVVKLMNDFGGIYTGKGVTQRGNHIRYNFIHDIPNAQGIYLDDMNSGNNVYDNVVYNVFRPLLIGGGRDVIVENNLILQSVAGSAESIIFDERGLSNTVYPGQGTWWDRNSSAILNELASMPYTVEPWKSTYPELAGILNDDIRVPKRAVVKNNVIYRHKPLNIANSVIANGNIGNNLYLESEEDMAFNDARNLDFSLNQDSIVFDLLPDFRNINFSKMGIYTDGMYRKGLPGVGDVSILMPQKGETDLKTGTVKLKWQPASAADSYRVLVSKNSDFSALLYDLKTGNEYAEITINDFDKEYYWKVEALSSVRPLLNAANESGTSSFHTITAPDMLKKVVMAAEIIYNQYPDYQAQDRLRFREEIDDAQGVIDTNPQELATTIASLKKLEAGISVFLNSMVGEISVNDTFDNDTAGEFPSPAIPQGQTGLGYVRSSNTDTVIRDIKVGSSEGADGKVLVVDDYSSTQYAVVQRSFSDTYGKVVVDYRIKPEQTNAVLNIKLRNGGANDPVYIIFNNNGNINLGVNGFEVGPVLQAYEANSWYDIKYIVDLVNRKYDIYINGNKRVSDRAFDSIYSTIGFLNSLVLTSGANSEAGRAFIGKFDIDFFRIATWERVDVDQILADTFLEALDLSITGTEPVSVVTSAGTAPVLPGRVTVNYSNGMSLQKSVVWETVEASRYAAVGTFTVAGILTETGDEISIAVNVIDPIPVSEITVTGADGQNMITYKSGTLQMEAAVLPANASNKAVTWSVENDTGSALISTGGLLTAVSDGTVAVKATAQDGSEVFGKYAVTISGQTVPQGSAPDPYVAPEPAAAPETADMDIKPALKGTTAESVINAAALNRVYSFEKADENGERTVTVNISEVAGAKEYLQQLPAEIFLRQDHEETGRKIVLNTPIGTMTIPDDMFIASDVRNAKNVGISIGLADLSDFDSKIKNKIGNKPVIEINASVDGKKIVWNNPNAKVQVSLNYKPTEEELKNPDSIVVCYIDGNGKIQSVPTGKYDPSTGKVTFTTTHFSTYAIAYDFKTFPDAGKHKWAQKSIEAMASKGIMKGTTDTLFNPDKNITRAEFLDSLVRSLGLSIQFDTNFSDVDKSYDYYDSIGIAKKLGITAGSGNGKFNPDSQITRQEMAVFVVRAMKLAGKKISEGSISGLNKYSDASKIAAYAVENMAILVNKGILAGYENRIDPAGEVTRAQAAVVLYKVYNMI